MVLPPLLLLLLLLFVAAVTFSAPSRTPNLNEESRDMRESEGCALAVCSSNLNVAAHGAGDGVGVGR